MRYRAVCFFVFAVCGFAVAQSSSSDVKLLAKARSLYDAPFNRGLVSFDCAVQFDWKKHFVEMLGGLPVAAVPTAERLQSVQHRISVDRAGAVISSDPKVPELAALAKAAELENIFNAMVSSALNAWLPSSTNVILPVPPTNFNFQKIDPGYKLTMSGPNLLATLLISDDMRVTSIVSQSPDAMRYTTRFNNGPEGYLLGSLESAPIADPTGGEASFSYTYQSVQNYQLPSLVTVVPSTGKAWRFSLTDCKATAGILIKALPLKK